MQFFLKFKNNNAKMTYLEVAKAALEKCDHSAWLSTNLRYSSRKELDKNLKSAGRTPQEAMSTQLYMNVRDRQNLFL